MEKINQLVSGLNQAGVTLTNSIANTNGVTLAAPIIAMILAFVFALFGYRAKKITFFIAWFIIGYTLANRFVPVFFTDQPYYIILIVTVLLGLLLGFLGIKVEKLAIFCVAAYFTYAFLTNFGVLNGFVSDQILLFCLKIIISFIMGAVAVNFTKPVIILLTSLFAGGLVNTYLPQLTGSYLTPTVILIISILVAVAGFIFQLSTTKDED